MSMLERVRRAAATTQDYLAALIRSRTFWSGVLAMAGFWTVAWFTPFLPLYAGVSIILLIVSCRVLLRYLPGFLEALVAGRLNDGEQLVLGVWVAWAGDIMLRTWAMTQLALDQPPWMLTSDVVTFLIFVKLLGATLHLTSPGTVEGRVPRENWVWIAIGVVIGALLTAAVLAMSIGAGCSRLGRANFHTPAYVFPEVRLNLAEGGVQVGADALHDSDDGDRDADGDQAVLNGSRSGLIYQKRSNVCMTEACFWDYKPQHQMLAINIWSVLIHQTLNLIMKARNIR